MGGRSRPGAIPVTGSEGEGILQRNASLDSLTVPFPRGEPPPGGLPSAFFGDCGSSVVDPGGGGAQNRVAQFVSVTEFEVTP